MSLPAVDFRLDGRVCVVTGGGSGIGRATALALAAAGGAVAVVDLDEAAASAVAQEIDAGGGTASDHGVDVAREEAVRRLFGAVLERHGQIDILVNSAGMALRHPTIEHSLEDWEKVVAVNTTGVFLCAREAGRAMIEAGRGGAIVNLGSIMSFSGGGLYPNISYQTTKGSIVNLTRALAVEWAPHRIRVNAVAPTWVRTRFIAPLMADEALMEKVRTLTPLGRIAEPEEIAAAILFLASPAAAMVTGHTLVVDGGFLAQ